MSWKAKISASSYIFRLGISPRTILQKTQFSAPIPISAPPWHAACQRSRPFRRSRKCLGGHHCLGRFLADFFQDCVGSAREQPRHVGFFRVAGLARLDHVRQPLEYVAHRPYISLGSLITGSTVTQRPLSSFWKKQLCLPVWQAIPPPCSTLSSTTSSD